MRLLMLTQSTAAVLMAIHVGPLSAILARPFLTKMRFTMLLIGYSLSLHLRRLCSFFAALISITTLLLIKDRTNAPLD
jgi:hypothetical protein